MAKLGFTFDPAAHAEPGARETNLAVALGLAEAGIAVFPARVVKGAKKWDKTPLVEWRKAATTDPAIVRRWWMQFPDALAGIELAMSELVVVDADRHGGPDGVSALKDLVDANGGLPDGPVVETAGGGLHYIFRNLSQEPLGNARGNLPDGIDVRGAGGWIVAPGSVRADGSVYGTLEGRPSFLEAIGAGTVPPVPSWVVDIIKTPKARDEAAPPAPPVAATSRPASSAQERAYAEAALEDECAAVAGAYPGTRNDALNRAALKLGHQVAAGRLSRHEVTQALIAASQASGLAKDDGMPSVLKTIASGINAGMREPAPPLDDTADHDEAVGVASSAALLRERIDPKTGEIVSEPHSVPKEQAFLKGRHVAGEDRPPLRWLFKGLLPEVGSGLIAGQPQAGKTFLSLELCGAIMRGTDFLGCRNRRPGGVLYINLEGRAGFHLRLAALAKSLGVAEGELPLVDYDRLMPLQTQGRRGAFEPGPGYHEIIARAKHESAEFQRRFGVPLVAIVIDTLMKVGGHTSVNDAAEMSSLVAMLDAIAKETGTFVFAVDHLGKDAARGPTGSLQKVAGVDVVWSIALDKQDDTERAFAAKASDGRVLTVQKSRDGEAGGQHRFRLGIVDLGEDEDGDEIVSCRIDWTQAETTQQPASGERRNRRSKTLSGLMKAFGIAVGMRGKNIHPFGYDGPLVTAVQLNDLRDAFYQVYIVDNDDPVRRDATKRMAFSRARSEAQEARLLEVQDVIGAVWAWTAKKMEEPG